MKIKRYSVNGPDADITEDGKDGEFVDYADHIALMNKVETTLRHAQDMLSSGLAVDDRMFYGTTEDLEWLRSQLVDTASSGRSHGKEFNG